LSEHLKESTATAGRVPMGAYVDNEQHERLAELAATNERSLSAEVRLALREHLERELAGGRR
jgi:predicted transcriptional regulator